MRTLRNKDGTFSRINKLWTPDFWNNGYYDNDGRFRVYRPDYPNCYKGGYALRSHVVYWLFNGCVHPVGTELHHIDKTKDNDNISNLIVLTKSQHRKVHQENWVVLKCEYCGKEFNEHFWRVSGRKRTRHFCSQKCYFSYPKDNKRIKQKCLECGTEYEIIKSKNYRKFCSNPCAAKYNWRIRHAHFG